MKKFRNKSTDRTEVSNETINTCSLQNCFSSPDEIPGARQSSDRERGRVNRWNKSTPTELETSEEYSRTICNGITKRVRKRISRGVQTHNQPNAESLSAKKKILGLLRFKWRSGKESGKYKKREKRSEIETSETSAEDKNVQVNSESRKNSGSHNDDVQDSIGSDATSADRNDKKTRERPVQTNGSDMQKKNYNRKYDFSIDGTNIQIIRTEKNGTGEKSPTPHGEFADPQKKRSNTAKRKRRRPRIEHRGKNAADLTNDERNLLVSDGGSSGQIDERRSNKSETHEAVKRKDETVDKTVRIDDPKKAKTVNNRALNGEDKDASHEGGKTDKSVIGLDEKPKIERGTVRSKESKKSSPLKLFTRSGRKSVTPRQPPNEESHDDQGKRNDVPRSELLISKQLDARRNDIADVKRRLDACIADLNDMILNLSQVFQQIPTSSGPAGEGTPSENKNRSSRRGR